MPDVTLITCTGLRPDAFELCKLWMGRQTFRGAVQWIVVDDGEWPSKTTQDQTVVRPTPPWRMGQVTLQRNLREAILLVKSDKVLIIEDDDYYAPEYVERMVQRLDEASMVAETGTYYYHVRQRRYMDCRNSKHGSLFQTGLRRAILPKLQALCSTASYFLDLGIWSEVADRKLFPPSRLSLGVKGMPGRAGIGMGHREHPNWAPDLELDFLKDYIGGGNAQRYAPYYRAS